MDDYPYDILVADGWLRCNGLHHLSFPTLLPQVLHHFGFTGTPAYRRLYHDFRRGRCEVYVDILTHPSDLSLMAWFTMTTGDDLDDTMERATHRALMEFCECHLSGLTGTAVTLFPIWDVADPMWSEHLATACNTAFPTYQVGWAFTTRYAQHMSSLL
jgi:hypothetical protein